MSRTLWAAMALTVILVVGTMVTAQETTPQPAMPQTGEMGSMMGMGMMGREGQKGQPGSMMPMTQGMSRMMEACSQMMSGSSSTSEGQK